MLGGNQAGATRWSGNSGSQWMLSSWRHARYAFASNCGDCCFRPGCTQFSLEPILSSRTRSEERQVLVDLPLRHLTMIRSPLTTFQLDELVRDRTQGSPDHLVLAQLLQRLVQRLRQDADALAADLGKRALVHVAEVWLAGIELLVDPVQPRGDVGGQRKVGVAARRYGPVLEVAGAGGADHLRSVVVTVGDEGRRPGEAAPRRQKPRPQLQSLVAVDRRARHGAQSAGMAEDTAEEVVRQLRAAQSAAVGSVLEQRLARLGVGEMVVDVEPAAGAIAERLGHVRGDRPVLLRQLRRRHLEEGDAVGRG